MVFFHIEHLDDACRADVAFCYAGIETVAAKVVHAVHVELSADQLVQELLGVFVLEYLDGKCELSVHFFVDTLHQHEGDILVRYALYDGVFQYMREGTVSDVMHQNGCLYCFGFTVENEVSLAGELLDSFARQMESPQRMLKARVLCTGINHRRQTQLLDAV